MNYKPKTYYIKTFGCQANIADSAAMAGILENIGFEPTILAQKYANDKEELLDVLPRTDLFIVNSCSVRQKSEDKVYGIGKIIKELKDKNKAIPFMVLSGCMVGSVTGERKRYDFSKLEKKTPWANMYMSPSQVFELPELLVEEGFIERELLKKYVASDIDTVQPEKNNAYVNISYGCDNFCSYCVVPFARGKEISRSEKEIIDEVSRLVSRGYSHITLCAQNVNSWGLDIKEKFKIRAGSKQKLPFAELLRKIHDVEGIEKIDFLSSNPFDFTQDLIETLKLPKISNYLHIAVQSGNNEVLEKMNRRHTIEDFLDLVEKIKSVRPNIELGTDIIVGFPGETEEQFNDTVELFKKVEFRVAYISIYSVRKGTPAEKFMKDDVSFEEKKRRHKVLTKVWKENRIK